MSRIPPTAQFTYKRFDAFLDFELVQAWNQELRIFNEIVKVEQSGTGSIVVIYAGVSPEVLALLAALSAIYRGFLEPGGRSWHFHAQIQPCVQIALLALQDKAPSCLVEDIVRSQST